MISSIKGKGANNNATIMIIEQASNSIYHLVKQTVNLIIVRAFTKAEESVLAVG